MHIFTEGKSPKYSDIKKIPVIAQKCNQWEGFQLEKAQFIAPDTFEKYADERLLQDKDILINSTGLGTVGRNQIYPASENPYGIAVADSHVTVVRLNSKAILPEYFFHYWRNLVYSWLLKAKLRVVQSKRNWL